MTGSFPQKDNDAVAFGILDNWHVVVVVLVVGWGGVMGGGGGGGGGGGVLTWMIKYNHDMWSRHG